MSESSPEHFAGRLWAIALVLAMIAAGCSDSGSDDAESPASTTSSTPSPGADPATESASVDELVAAAIGEGVDTQDFQFLVDIAVVDDTDAETSFFEDALARADEGRGDPVDLDNGLLYVPTDSVEGAIVDADGSPVPGASIGFGLLEVADGDASRAAVPEQWVADTTSEALETSRALVMFSTTRRSEGATHIGFGDRFELDITFVADVAPGDTVRQTTMHGQALRLAGEDATADDQDIFTARIAAGSAGVVTTVDDGVVFPEITVTDSVAIEGSTKTQTAIKAGLGAAVITAAFVVTAAVCLETVGLGCAASVIFVVPRLKFVRDQIRKGNDPDCPGTRFPGASGPGGGRDTSPGGGGDGFLAEGVAFRQPTSDDEAHPVQLGPATHAPSDGTYTLVAAVAQEDDGGGDGVGGDGDGDGGGGDGGGGSGGGGCGGPSAGGDIHLRTIDGTAYDLQSVGEFVIARSSGGHEIQLRTAPFGTSRRVSVGAAIAADVAGTAVMVTTDPERVDVTLDGTAVDVARGDFVAVGDRGALVSTGEAVMIVWPDGSQLNVYRRGGHIDVRFFPSDVDTLTWEGLWGDADGDRANDLRLPDGTVLANPTVDDIHGPFADAWRVTDQTSLFHYDDGENTATYTDLSFPDQGTTAADLDPAALAAARTTCLDYGIVEEAALADCAYDLAITGDLAFLLSAGLLQDSATVGGSDPSPAPVDDRAVRTGSTALNETIRGDIAEAGDVERHEFEADAGDRVWITVDSVNDDCTGDADEHLGWELLAPDGTIVDAFGDMRACPERGPIALETTGTYTLIVSAGNNDPSTGTYELRLRGVGPDDDTATTIGATVSGEIESVGVSDFHRFEAHAADRVWITVDSVNDDCTGDADEHLGWELLAPDGTIVDAFGDMRACPERGPIALETTGTYTLIVSAGNNDPSTGTYQLRLLDVPADDESETTIGATVSGEIESVGVSDFHRFEADASDRVWITVDSVNDDCTGDADEHLGWELLAADGTIVDAFGDMRACPERGPIALETTGTYTLIVSAGNNDPSTGTYQLRLLDVPADDESETTIGASVSGEIESAGVSDRYAFEATAGDNVWITVDSVNDDCTGDADEHLGWELLAADGTIVDAFGDMRACPERGPIALETTGTYTLIVSAGNNDPSTGTYQLRLLDEAP